jgi:hypothetical protein
VSVRYATTAAFVRSFFSAKSNEKLIAIASYRSMAMGMLYTLDIKALGRGVGAMRCAGCGAEVILTNVVPENTVAVPGFEHHTCLLGMP